MRRMSVLLAAGLLLVVGCTTGESGQTTSTSTSTASTSTSTSSPSTASSTTAADPCDTAPVYAAVGEVLAQARLPVIGSWAADTSASPFVGRTADPATFADALGLDCSLLAAKNSGDDGGSLLLAAWTGGRRVLVVQTTDQPAEPYAADATVDILLEAPAGEWVADGVWAVSLGSGETLVIASEDSVTGLAAKSWTVGPLVPDDGDGEGETATEQYAIDVLESAGGRNVGLGEPSHGSPVASISFITPAGNPMIATVGPVGAFDPGTPNLSGPSTTETIGAISVTVTEPGPDQYSIVEVGFVCGPYAWRLETGSGTVDEARAFTIGLIDTLGC